MMPLVWPRLAGEAHDPQTGYSIWRRSSGVPCGSWKLDFRARPTSTFIDGRSTAAPRVTT